MYFRGPGLKKLSGSLFPFCRRSHIHWTGHSEMVGSYFVRGHLCHHNRPKICSHWDWIGSRANVALFAFHLHIFVATTK